VRDPHNRLGHAAHLLGKPVPLGLNLFMFGSLGTGLFERLQLVNPHAKPLHRRDKPVALEGSVVHCSARGDCIVDRCRMRGPVTSPPPRHATALLFRLLPDVPGAERGDRPGFLLSLGDQCAYADDRMKDELGGNFSPISARNSSLDLPTKAFAAPKPLRSGAVSISQTMTLDGIVQTLELRVGALISTGYD
jgi:hypothetical protein